MITGLYRKSLLAMVAALALPLLIVLLLQFSQLSANQKKIETDAQERAKHISRLVDMHIESNLSALKMLAMRRYVTEEDWAHVKTPIVEASSLNPQWKNILVIDLSAQKIIYAREKTVMPVLPTDISAIQTTKPVVDGITVAGTNCPCVYLYAAVPSKNNAVKYVIAAALDPHIAQNIMLGELPKDTLSAVIDREGDFIARWPNYEEKVGMPATSYLREAIKKSSSGIYPAVSYEGLKNYTAFHTSPEFGWSSHVAYASSLIDGPRMWSLLTAIIGTLLAVLLSGALVFYVMRQYDGVAAGQLAAIVESSDDAIISKNLDGIIASWNASAEKIFGYSSSEVVGKHISLIIPQDRLEEESEIITKIKSGTRVSHYETVRNGKGGRPINLSITVSPVRDNEGLIVGASKVARDITERKTTEAQLAEERETLETLNRLAPALATTLDLQSLIQIATDEAREVTGAAFGAFFYNVTNEEGKSYLLYTLSGAPREAFEKFGMPRATAVFAPTFKGQGTIISDDIKQDPRYGKNAPHKGMPEGHLPVTSYLAVPVISRSGEVIGGLFFGHPDVGVFKERDARIVEGIAALAAVGIDNARLYEQVKLGQKRAEDANRAKTDFLATMSHEIRTPMNAIIGLSSILGMTEPLTYKQKEFVKTLQSSADSLLQLINDLLDISKIEARNMELEETPFSLERLIGEVVSMMSVKALEKGLKFSVDADSIVGQTFIGDPVRMRQVIINLCGNAIKFTESGSVTIKIMSEKTSDINVAKINIRVEDSGIGIAEDKLDTIFEKFVQADTTINRKYGGTGLGLSITRRLVTLMKGEITVESTPGKGSVFIVSLPMQRASDFMLPNGNKTAAISNVIPKEGHHKILLVEDHEPNIMVAGTFLENMGYGYDVARNGGEAVERATTRHYDAILMDVQMPGMNGFEATHLIREFEKKRGKKRVPIIGITAHAMAGDRERCIAEGMDEYLSKPFNVPELENKLRDLIGKS